MDFLWIFLIALQQKIKWNYAHLHLNLTQRWDKFFLPILHSCLTYILEEMKFQVTEYFLDNVWGRNIVHTIIFTSTKVWVALEAMIFKEYEPQRLASLLNYGYNSTKTSKSHCASHREVKL